MDNNKLNKVKDFVKKEAFYLILFVCLCAVAIVAAITINNDKPVTKQKNPVDQFSLNLDNEVANKDLSNIDKENADRVEANDEDKTEVADNNVAEDTSKVEPSTEVSSNVENEEVAEASSSSVTTTTFTLPLEGTISRTYDQNEGLVEIKATGNISDSFVSKLGIDISTSVGTTVKAAAEGKVEEVSKDTTYGTYVVIAHANGLKTKYTNLSEDVAVAVGDAVSAGAEIGKVGNTSEIFTSEQFGDLLNLQVFNAEGIEVNPADYFKF